MRTFLHALLIFGPVFGLAACGGDSDAPAPDATASLAPQENTPLDWRDFEALRSEDCRTVAQFYFDAVAAQQFKQAALVWDDPVVDDARLAALFAGYTQPQFTIDQVMEEGAAGTLYCTVTGALADLGDPSKVLREGEVVLRRVNNIPGASGDQMRWTVQSSTFIEDMQRAGRGEPA